MKRIQVFLLNAAIMTATSLALSSIGVWFNLYITEKIGAQGMGLFQLIMSVYTFAVTLSASGINLATTRLVAEESETGSRGVKSAMHRCLAYCVCFGCVTAVGLYTFAPFIATQWLRSPQTIAPLQLLAFSLPFVAVSCTLNGYFTAVRRVVKNAASQVFEQFCKITLTIFGLSLLMPRGLDYACIAIVAAGAVSEGLSCLLSFILYLLDSRRYKGGGAPSAHLTGRLLGIALPVAFSSYIRSGLSTVKNLLVPIRLQASGLTAAQSFAVLGLVGGVVMPVIIFPSAFLNSFSSLIVPELARYRSQNRSVEHLVNRMFQLNMFFSVGVCGILFFFANEIGAAVSHNPDVAVYIRLLAPVIPVLYLDTAVDCMLKGLNEQVSVMRYNVIDALLSVIMVYTLLPIMGIKGYILVICASEVFNFTLSLNRLIKVTSFRVNISEQVVKPVLCIAIATLCAAIFSRVWAFSAVGDAIMVVVCSCIFYLILMFSCGCCKREMVS